MLTEKRRRGPSPTGKGVLVGVRLQPDLLDALDRSIVERSGKLSRPEAIRSILNDWLVGQGLLPHREDPEGAN